MPTINNIRFTQMLNNQAYFTYCKHNKCWQLNLYSCKTHSVIHHYTGKRVARGVINVCFMFVAKNVNGTWPPNSWYYTVSGVRGKHTLTKKQHLIVVSMFKACLATKKGKTAIAAQTAIAAANM